MTNAIKELSRKADKVVVDRGVQGKVGLHMSSEAWDEGKIELVVMTSIPQQLTCDEAKELGWALYMLGKYGKELSNEYSHELDEDEKFFAN